MADTKRIAITTAIGILTGLYCAGSLLVIAPPGVHPEPWFMAAIVYGRSLQGLAIGFADTIPVRPVLRGAGIGALFSIWLCIVPVFSQNFIGAVLLLVAGMIYGALADGIAGWWLKRSTGTRTNSA